MTLKEFKTIATAHYAPTPKMPVLFVGHGNPMNGIEWNDYSLAWAELGKKIPRPAAVLCVSAHWLTRGTYVHVAEKPKTIHDFYGFPEELYKIEYPCPGSPEFTQLVRKLVKRADVLEDLNWGLDHGTWIVMMRIFPEANVPVFQLSIDITKSALEHYEIGKELAELRERGVLIVGSGNIVHNLGLIEFEPGAKPYDWALEFDEVSKNLLAEGNHKGLIEYEKLGEAAKLAIPTPDHYWPLMYAIALQGKRDTLSFAVDGIAHASVSMRAVLIG